jgi:hypothetical protein
VLGLTPLGVAGAGYEYPAFHAHLMMLRREQKLQHAQEQYRMDGAEAALDLAISAARHDMKTRRPNNEEETNV